MATTERDGLGRRGFLQRAGAIAAASTAFVAAPALPAPGAPPAATEPVDGDRNSSDIVVEALIAWGATHAFGIVGDGINPVVEALRRRRDRIAFVGVRHEEAAAFMACAYAKHTGRLGVCLATTGPARSISSTDSTTPASTTRRSSRSPARRSATWKACASCKPWTRSS